MDIATMVSLGAIFLTIFSSLILLIFRTGKIVQKIENIENKIDKIENKMEKIEISLNDIRERIGHIEGYLMGPEIFIKKQAKVNVQQ